MKDLGIEEISNNEGMFHLQSSLTLLGNDLLVIVSGLGDHIGSITLAQPYTAPLNPNMTAKHIVKEGKERVSSSISTLTQFHHRDDQLLSEFARNLSQQLNRVVTVVGGIHVNNISKDDIKEISSMLATLEEKIIKKMEQET